MELPAFLFSILLGCTCIIGLLALKEKSSTWMDNNHPFSSFRKKGLELDPNCPYHPIPEDLPTKLPDSISSSLDKVEQQLKSMLNSTSLPAIAYSVTYKGETIRSQGLGTKVVGKMDPPDENTILRIGSVSKVFAVLVLFQMVDKKMPGLTLDSLVSSVCPDFSMQTEYDITLRQLASQMSGLPREAPCRAATATVSCPSTTKDIVMELKKQKLLHPPWTKPSYSNLAYSLLGNCLVEKFAAGMTYELYVHKNIIVPLNMTKTGFEFTSSVKEQMAVGYNVDGSVAPLISLGYENPAGQMYSTTHDLDTFAQFFMSGSDDKIANSVLSPTLRKQMLTTVYVNRDLMSGFGTPWEISFQANYTVLRKGGNVGGYSALFSFVPELELSFNVLFSGAADEFGASNGGYSELIPAFVSVLSTLQKPYPYPPDPKTYEGHYVGGNVDIVIETHNNQLTMRQTISPNSPATTAYLAYHEPLYLQILFSDSLQPCLLGELLAQNGEWVYFASPVNGVSPSFTMPGFLGSAEFEFKRVK